MQKIYEVSFQAGGPGQNISVPVGAEFLALTCAGDRITLHLLAKAGAEQKEVHIEQASPGHELLDNNKQQREYLGAAVFTMTAPGDAADQMVFHVFARHDGDPLRRDRQGRL